MIRLFVALLFLFIAMPVASDAGEPGASDVDAPIVRAQPKPEYQGEAAPEGVMEKSADGARKIVVASETHDSRPPSRTRWKPTLLRSTPLHLRGLFLWFYFVVPRAIAPSGIFEPVHVREYYRRDGTYVRAHFRSRPSR